MDNPNNRITLYSSQSDEIAAALRNGDTHYAKEKYIREKYGEVSEVFLAAYSWYRAEASRLVPRPPEAESGIWAYADLKLLDRVPGYSILKLSVPADEAVFFRTRDWNRVLNLRFIGETEEEERVFEEKLARHGVKYEGDIYLKPFYPQLRSELIKSWSRLFRFHEAIRAGSPDIAPDIQAGLWRIVPEWVAAID